MEEEEKVPKGSQRKKVRMESEPGGSGWRMEEQEEWMLRQELRDFGKRCKTTNLTRVVRSMCVGV